ncbi:MAG: hypothetical protein ACYTFY_19175 [Planctomycetota bacterium]|jgi:hypothetical protein
MKNLIEKLKKDPSSPFKFVYAADMQPGTPKSFRYRKAWRENWFTARQQIIDAAFIATETLSEAEDTFGQGGHVSRGSIDYSESEEYLKNNV